MKLYVPEIGNILKLTQDWKFKLYQEYRNKSLMDYFGITYTSSRETQEFTEVSIPSGSLLKVDRVYIRKGLHEYSSISFYVELPNQKGKPQKCRFWASLQDCNNIYFDIHENKAPLKLETDSGYIKKGDQHHDPSFEDFMGKKLEELPKNHTHYTNLCKVVNPKEWIKLFKIKSYGEIGWKPYTTGLFGQHTKWCGYYKKVKYTLYTLSDEELGTWSDISALRKYVKELIEKNESCDSEWILHHQVKYKAIDKEG